MNTIKQKGNQFDAKQVLSVIEKYNSALDMLDEYDHQTMSKPKGSKATYVLTYDECRAVINEMKFAAESDLLAMKRTTHSRAA